MSVTCTLSPVVTKLLDDFCQWATTARTPQSSQLSAYTAKRYRRYTEGFILAHGHPLRAANEDLIDWRRSLEGDSAQTVNVKISALRVFFEYLISRGLRTDDPTRAITMQKVPDRQPRFLSRRVMEKLFDTVYELPDLQDRAILEVLYGSGLRREEAGNLRLYNIYERDKLRVIGKGNKERFTIITEPEYQAIRDVCLSRLGDARTSQVQEEFSADTAFEDLRKRMPETPIFYNVDGRPLTDMADPGHFIRNRVAHFGQLIGEEITPHQFRHSFATHLLSEGVDIFKVSKMLGHTDIKTTTIYLGLEDRVFAEVRAAHPRAHAIPDWARAA